MPVYVKLSTTLRDTVPKYDPASGILMDIAPGATVAMLAESLGLPGDEIAIVMVNGVRASMQDALAEDDRVAFFPAVGGG